MTQFRGKVVIALACLQVLAWTAYGPASAQNRAAPGGSFRSAETSAENKKKDEEQSKRKHQPQPQRQQQHQPPRNISQPPHVNTHQPAPHVQAPHVQAPADQRRMKSRNDDGDARENAARQKLQLQQQQKHNAQIKARDDAARNKAAADEARKKQQMRDAQMKARSDAAHKKAAADEARKKQLQTQRPAHQNGPLPGRNPGVTTGQDSSKGPAGDRKKAGRDLSRKPPLGNTHPAGSAAPVKGRIAPIVRTKPTDPKILEVKRTKKVQIRRQVEVERKASKDEKRQDHVKARMKAQDARLRVLHQSRQEIKDPSGRTIIKESGNRMIIRDPGAASKKHGKGRRTGAFIVHDETERFRRAAKDVRVEKRGHETYAEAVLPSGAVIVTVTGENGHAIRRIRRDRSGHEVVLFDNGPRRAGIGFGAFAGLYLNLSPPVIEMPRDRYIVDLEDASEDDLMDVLSSPPIEDLGRGYSMDEVLHNVELRQRMRSIDVDTLTFEFGAWEVPQEQYSRLEDVAGVLNDILERHPDEMFLIEGHTDAVGSDEDNLSLSDRRAEGVATVLSQQFNVPMENLMTQGYGWHYLKVDTSEPERANRRVTIRRITPLLARGYGEK